MKKYKVLFCDLDDTLIETLSGKTFPKCTRNSEQPLTHDLSALVGLYVEKV